VKGCDVVIIDTHAHLNMKDFDHDIDEVLFRSRMNNVKHIIVIGMDKDSNLRALNLSQRYFNLHPTFGIHPGYVDHADINDLKDILRIHRPVAIGECGIDLYWKQNNLNLQKEFFLEQVELAIKHDLPLVVHMRNSFDVLYDLLVPYKGLIRGVFHCFSSDLKDAKKIIDLGFHIGIDGPVTYKNNEDIVDILKHIDLKHILIETDSPYLAPLPHRGSRNEPSYLTHVVEKIAEIKGITQTEVERVTSLNAMKLFSLGGKLT
jgi:TatD DNase family protein